MSATSGTVPISQQLTERQLQTRSVILATARDLIAERGYDGVTMRALAQESGVAYKTLFDIYGNKDNLLRTAIEDRLADVYEEFATTLGGRGFDRLMHLLQRSADATLEFPNLARALEPILAADPGRFSIKSIYSGIYREILSEIEEDGGFVDWADIDLLQGELMLENASARLYWANGVITDDHLAPALQFAACKMLVPVTSGKVRESVEIQYRHLHGRMRDVFIPS